MGILPLDVRCASQTAQRFLAFKFLKEVLTTQIMNELPPPTATFLVPPCGSEFPVVWIPACRLPVNKAGYVPILNKDVVVRQVSCELKSIRIFIPILITSQSFLVF